MFINQALLLSQSTTSQLSMTVAGTINNNFKSTNYHDWNTNTRIIPPAAQVGDMAIFWDSIYNYSDTIPTAAVPSGWTTVNNTTEMITPGGGATRSIISYKKLVSADITAGSVTGMTKVGNSAKMMCIFRPSRAIDTITLGSIHGHNGGGTNNAPPDALLDMSGISTPVLAFIFWRHDYDSGLSGELYKFTPAGWTLEIGLNRDYQFDSNYSIYGMAWKIYNPGDTPIDITASYPPYGSYSGSGGPKILQVFYMQLT
jgi:hypothetical protein